MRIDCRNIAFSHRSRHESPVGVFRDLTLDIAAGESVGVMGGEGSGKSTLLHLMDGLLVPDSGTLTIDGASFGADPASRAAIRKQIGFAFQFPEQQFFSETVREELRYSLKVRNIQGAAAEDKAADALRQVGLDPAQFFDRSPFSLSFGESRKVAVAVMLVGEPRLALIDEPTAGLDAAGSELVAKVMRTLRDRGTTLVVAAHDVDLLAGICSRVIVLADGGIAADQPAERLLVDDALLDRFGYAPPEVVLLAREWRREGRPSPSGLCTLEQLIRSRAQEE